MNNLNVKAVLDDHAVKLSDFWLEHLVRLGSLGSHTKQLQIPKLTLMQRADEMSGR